MTSIPKPVAHLRVDLSRISVVRAAKSLAVVQQKPAIGQVEGCHADAEAFSNTLAQRKIERRMCREVRRYRRITIGKARTVIQIAAHRKPSRQVEVESGMQCVALIVVEQKVSGRGR